MRSDEAARRGVELVDIAENETAAVEIEDHRARRRARHLRGINAGADIAGRAGDQVHLHADTHLVMAVAQDPAQRHVEGRLGPRLGRPAGVDRLAAHAGKNREHVLHVGIEMEGAGIVAGGHDVARLSLGEPAHLYR